MHISSLRYLNYSIMVISRLLVNKSMHNMHPSVIYCSHRIRLTIRLLAISSSSPVLPTAFRSLLPVISKCNRSSRPWMALSFGETVQSAKLIIVLLLRSGWCSAKVRIRFCCVETRLIRSLSSWSWSCSWVLVIMFSLILSMVQLTRLLDCFWLDCVCLG